MEVLGAVVTVAGLTNGIIKLAKTVNEIKEKWNYASLNITMVSSSLWAVKAALEEIAEWRLKSTDKSQKSEQLDTNLEVCVQSCALMVAVVERSLGEIDINNISRWEKARFIRLDTIFKDLSSHLADQVRALQLLLTIYQCRTLGEQNEQLQRTHTRRLVNAVRESAASLNYEERDISDAASYLSDAPTTNFDFDRILIDTPLYSRTYPRLHKRMQQTFPTRMNSVASTVRAGTLRKQPLPENDPFSLENTAVPFFGVPYQGEKPIEQSDEPEKSSFIEANDKLMELSKLRSNDSTGTPPDHSTSDDVAKSEPPIRNVSQGNLYRTAQVSKIAAVMPIPAHLLQDPKNPDVSKDTSTPDARPQKRNRKSFNSLYDDSGDEQEFEHVKSVNEGQFPAPSITLPVEDERDLSTHSAPIKSASLGSPNTSSAPFTIAARTLSQSIVETQAGIVDRDEELVAAVADLPTTSRQTDIVSESDRSKNEPRSPLTDQENPHLDIPQLTDVENTSFFDINFGPDLDLPFSPETPLNKHDKLLVSEDLRTDSGIKQAPSHHIAPKTQDSASKSSTSGTEEPHADNAESVPIASTQDTEMPQNDHEDESSATFVELHAVIQQRSSEDAKTRNFQEHEEEVRQSSQVDDHIIPRLPGQYPLREPPQSSATSVSQDGQSASSTATIMPIPSLNSHLEAPSKLPPSIPVVPGSGDEHVRQHPDTSNKLAPTQTRVSFDSRGSFQSDRSVSMPVQSSHERRGPASVVSADSSSTFQEHSSYYTQATSVTFPTISATQPSISRAITDHPQHEKKRLAITGAIVKHRLSNIGAKLSFRAGDRLSKLQAMIAPIDQDDSFALSKLIAVLDKPIDLSTLIKIGTGNKPQTVLMYAIAKGQLDCVSLLLMSDPSSALVLDKNGNSIFHHALTAPGSGIPLWSMSTVTQAHDSKTGRRLVDIVNKQGIAPIHLAAQYDPDHDVLGQLHQFGADLMAEDAEGLTALSYAISAQHGNNVLYLLQQGFDINHRNLAGETPLMIAAKNCAQSIFDILLNHGANKDLLDNDGNLAIHHVSAHGSVNMLEKLFLSMEDITAQNNLGQHPLHIAAANNNTEIISALLDIPGIKVNSWTSPPHTRGAAKRSEGLAATEKLASTALHLACSAGHYEATDILIRRGAMVKNNQEDGFSPVMMACQAQNAAIVSLLLLNAADPNCATAAEGLTALHIACRLDDLHSTKMLIEHGADTSAKMTNKEKDTPSSLAYRENSPDMQAAGTYSMRYRMQVLKMNSPTAQNQTRYAPNVRSMNNTPTYHDPPPPYT